MTVYYSNQLPSRHDITYRELADILTNHKINYQSIPNTRDIWCRDYMPIRGSGNRLVQFLYWPRYLRHPSLTGTLTPPTCYSCFSFSGEVIETGIILDGGSIEIMAETGIVSERVFDDNPWYLREDLFKKLMTLLGLSNLVVIPEEPGDCTGHVDGVVRFISKGRVVMNDYHPLGGKLRTYGKKVESLLTEQGLTVQKLIYVPIDKKGADGMPVATGCYINFLGINNVIIVPQFGINEDLIAYNEFRSIFDDSVVETVNCESLALQGGVLNCISWMH